MIMMALMINDEGVVMMMRMVMIIIDVAMPECMIKIDEV